VGFSIVDLMFTVALVTACGSLGVAQTLASLDDLRAGAAARYVATKLQQTRMEAVGRGHSAALRVTSTGTTYSVAEYVDGNRNGVLSRDIQSGTDLPIGAPEVLGVRFPGVTFGARPGIPSVDPGGVPPGTDPIRLGTGNMASFTPNGSSSSGSLYVLGRGGAQYVVRLFGQTGRTRVLKLDPRSNQWNPV
jgi:hypothetical protein